MEKIIGGLYEGERALYNIHGYEIEDATFANGESPLKECSDLKLNNIIFKWMYPLWYCKNVDAKNITIRVDARSGLWYSHNITIKDSVFEAPKQFRRCSNITLENVDIIDADEYFWSCKNVTLKNVQAKGDYFGMNTDGLKIENFKFSGKYTFDGAKNVEITNAHILSKDSFWNCENVVVKDSIIISQYIGWNSKNLTFINCTIDSEQGFCYMDNVKLVNCKLLNTNLAFERVSNLDAEITTKIDSVKNPYSGVIKAKEIGELILDEDIVDKTKTKIIIG